MPAYVQHLFEERLHDGFSLRDLATFAAALEHIMHEEVIQRLGDAYRASGLSVDADVNVTQLARALDVQMVMHLVPNMVSLGDSREKIDKVITLGL